MPISAVKVDATAVDVRVMDDRILVVLADGRELAAPLAWFPRLADATAAQRTQTDRATVEQVAGNRLIERSQPGDFVQDDGRSWIKKK